MFDEHYCGLSLPFSSAPLTTADVSLWIGCIVASAGDGGNSTTCYFGLTALLCLATGDWPQLPHTKRAGSWNKTADKAKIIGLQPNKSEKARFSWKWKFTNFKLTLQWLARAQKAANIYWEWVSHHVQLWTVHHHKQQQVKNNRKTDKRTCYHWFIFFIKPLFSELNKHAAGQQATGWTLTGLRLTANVSLRQMSVNGES